MKAIGIHGIVLASGQSKRMGKPKMHLRWHGKSILEHVLEKTCPIPFESVNVVIPSKDVRLKEMVGQYGYSGVPNLTPQKGMGHSLALAINSLPVNTEAVMILLGDQPTLCEEDVMGIWYTFQRKRLNHEYCPKLILQIKYQNSRIGHPTIFSHHFFDELRSIKEDKGGRDIIRENPDFLSLYYSKNNHPIDIDSPFDYQLLLKEEI